MELTAEMLTTRRGTNLDLDARHRDALAEYAKQAADAAGVPVQTWVRRTWGFKDYEAKHLIKGDATFPMWERILKQRGPHKGWLVAIPILGAVIGQDLADHFADERERVSHERARWAAEESRVAAMEAYARDRRSFARDGARKAPQRAGDAVGQGGLGASAMGRSPAQQRTD